MAKGKSTAAPSQPNYGTNPSSTGGKSSSPPGPWGGGKNARPPGDYGKAQTQLGYDIGTPSQGLLGMGASPAVNPNIQPLANEMDRLQSSAAAQATPIGMVGSAPAGGFGPNRNEGGEWQGALGPETGHRLLPDGSYETLGGGTYSPQQGAPATRGNWNAGYGSQVPWQQHVNALRNRGA